MVRSRDGLHCQLVPTLVTTDLIVFAGVDRKAGNVRTRSARLARLTRCRKSYAVMRFTLFHLEYPPCILNPVSSVRRTTCGMVYLRVRCIILTELQIYICVVTLPELEEIVYRPRFAGAGLNHRDPTPPDVYAFVLIVMVTDCVIVKASGDITGSGLALASLVLVVKFAEPVAGGEGSWGGSGGGGGGSGQCVGWQRSVSWVAVVSVLGGSDGGQWWGWWRRWRGLTWSGAGACHH